ncbi:MAG TPA: hypothetical protein VIO32_04000, partial [Candidatus Baltobacteraceae bacterium]
RRLKPLGRTIRDLIAEFDRTPPRVLARESALVIDSGTGSDDVLERYMQFVRSGTRPQIVLSARSNDEPYLNARGIRSLRYLK